MEPTRSSRRRNPILTGRGEVAAYAVLVVLSLSLVVLPDSHQRQLATYVEDFALYPFRQLVVTVERVRSMWETNRRLSEEVEALRLEFLRTAELRLENQRLRQMLGFSRASDFELIGCEVLGEGAGRLGGRTLLLDRGSLQGIRHHMPVTGREGLAGKIVEVYPETARAILLNHRDCAVSVRDTRSRLTGIVEWSPRSAGVLKLRGVSYLADVAPGDTLMTSGLGEVFPAGLMVGTVKEIARDVNGLLLDVSVRPAIDFSRLEEVFALVVEPSPAETGLARQGVPVDGTAAAERPEPRVELQ